MKNIIHIICVLILFSCTKEVFKPVLIERPGTVVFRLVEEKAARLSTQVSSFYLEHAYNVGVVRKIKTVVNIVGLGGGQATKSAWQACTTDNSFWCQMGWQTFGGSNKWVMMALTNGFPNLPSYTRINNWPPCTKGVHTLTQVVTDTGSVVIGIDGVDIIALNLGAKHFVHTEVATESAASSKPPNFPTVTWIRAFENMETGELLPYALYAGSGAWGVQGSIQNPSLAVGEIKMGSKIKTLQTGDYLFKL